MEKKDMSSTCGFKYGEYWYKANHKRTMTQEAWLILNRSVKHH